jgi:hypothetical protein
MTQYKGYYIDHICFNCKADIDAFIKELEIARYKKLAIMFSNHPTMEVSAAMSDLSLVLVNQYGLTWEQVEALEVA